MKPTRVLVMVLLAASPTMAQPAPASPPDCRGPEYRQFDFWIGEWAVTTPDGQLAGANVIESTLGGCALMESWTSIRGTAGRSINFYDRSSGQWYQSWIDERGGVLRMHGGLVNDSMVLHTEPSTQSTSGTVTHRITWSPEEGGTVRQHWESSTDGGRTWSTVFDGTYRRQTPKAP